ncbi:hypothetical protein ACOMHN_002481 [Nucella lapillus]
MRERCDSQWLQVDVGPPTLVTGVVTKGRGDTRRKHWVERFKIAYSNDTRVWYFYKDAHHLDPKSQWLWSPSFNTTSSHLIPDKYSEEGLLFGGNSDKEADRTHFLNSPFVARYVRFIPVEWRKKISMRVGLLGCPFTVLCLLNRANHASVCLNRANHASVCLNRANHTSVCLNRANHAYVCLNRANHASVCLNRANHASVCLNRANQACLPQHG